MADRFSETKMLQLVEIYRAHECLWNVTHPLYKNRSARERAYKQIWRTLNVPDLLLKDVPGKIKNLRSSYYQQLRKIESSKQSGASPEAVYRPKVSWFTTADTFLRSHKNKGGSFSDTDENSNMDDAPTSYNETNTQNVESVYNRNAGDDSDSDSDHDTSREQNKISKSRYSLRRPDKKFKSRDENEDNDFCEAIDRLTKISEKINSQSKEDEFDCFGKYIATTLRSLPPELSIMAKLELQKTISEIQLKTMRQSNSST